METDKYFVRVKMLHDYILMTNLKFEREKDLSNV